MIRNSCLITGAATLIVTGTVHAGGLVAEQIFFDDAGNALPADKVVIRVYWQAPGPADRLVGVVGSPSNPLSVSVTGGTFFDSDHFLATSRPPAFGIGHGIPGFEELSYDTWFTIGNTSLDVGPEWPSGFPFADQVIIAPGTVFDAGGGTVWEGGPGGPENVAWAVPPSQEDPGGGGIQPTPQSVAGNWAGDRVAIMQLVVDPEPGRDVNVFGSMGLLTIVDGQPAEVAGQFTFLIPAPPTVALLALAALGSRRRKGANSWSESRRSSSVP